MVTSLDSTALLEPPDWSSAGDISRQPVIAFLEALVGPDGAAATLACAGIAPWTTLGDLTEPQAAALRREVVRRCAVAPAPPPASVAPLAEWRRAYGRGDRAGDYAEVERVFRDGD